MKYEELKHTLKALDEECELKKKQAMKNYCDANNPYKIGDRFTDYIGSIKIEKIQYSFRYNGIPCCVYFGVELKKDGTPNKLNKKRQAWQSNEEKQNQE